MQIAANAVSVCANFNAQEFFYQMHCIWAGYTGNESAGFPFVRDFLILSWPLSWHKEHFCLCLLRIKKQYNGCGEKDFRFSQRRQRENRISLSLLRPFNAAFYRICTGTKIHSQTGRASGDTNFTHILRERRRQLIWAGAPSALDFRISAAAVPGAFKQRKPIRRFSEAEAWKRNQSAAIPSIFQLQGGSAVDGLDH